MEISINKIICQWHDWIKDNLVITINSCAGVKATDPVFYKPKMLFTSLCLSLASLISAASVRYSGSFKPSVTVTSPHTLKTYILYNSRSSTSFASAQTLCPPHSKLASISPDSGDIDFLGQFIESLDHPFWIDGSEFNTPIPCVALYAGGAVAIPKPSKSGQSPCDNHLNFICEATGEN